MIAARRLAAAPVFCVTDRRLVAERVLRAPLEIELDRIASATCLVAPPARGASAGVETNVVEVTCKDGATYSIGPVVEAGELCAILTSVGQGVADVRALHLARTASRRAPSSATTCSFARSSRSSGAPSGPVFLGPSALVGLASRLAGPPLYLALSVAGQAQPASEVERRMIDLARRETCGPAVVVLREGAALHVEGDALRGSTDRAAASRSRSSRPTPSAPAASRAPRPLTAVDGRARIGRGDASRPRRVKVGADRLRSAGMDPAALRRLVPRGISWIVFVGSAALVAAAIAVALTHPAAWL